MSLLHWPYPIAFQVTLTLRVWVNEISFTLFILIFKFSADRLLAKQLVTINVSNVRQLVFVERLVPIQFNAVQHTECWLIFFMFSSLLIEYMLLLLFVIKFFFCFSFYFYCSFTSIGELLPRIVKFA